MIQKTIRGKEGHYIMIEGSVSQEEITVLNVYAPNKSLKIREAKTGRTERRNG